MLATMNVIVRDHAPEAAPRPREPTRHKITRDEFHAMEAAGVFPAEAEFELIDGELIAMPADGHRTIEWNVEINRWLVESLGRPYRVVPDKSLGLSEHDEPKPDFWIFDASLKVEEVNGGNVLLIIEIADTTMRLDLRKAALYARAGVREYWLIDVENRRTLVHRLRGGDSYGEPAVVAADEVVQAELLSPLKFRIADFERLG
jgi:Uma2 family endonuclease